MNRTSTLVAPAAAPGLLRLYALAAGTCDTVTGLLLVAAPELVVRLLGLGTVAEPVFLRFVGVFVMSVGLAYLYPWWRLASELEESALWPVIFELTAVARAMVATFLGWALLKGVLPLPWISVLMTDAALAAAQGAWLYRRPHRLSQQRREE